MQTEFKFKGHIFLGYFKYGFKLLKPTYKLWYWNIFMTQNFSHLWAIMDHDHGDNLSLGAQSLPFNITEIKITPFIQWRQSLKSLRHMFPVTLYWRVTSTFPLYFCPTIDDKSIFSFRRDESDPVWSLHLCQGGLCSEPHLCVLRPCDQRQAHSLVRCSLQSIMSWYLYQVEGVRVTEHSRQGRYQHCQ